MAVCAVTAEDRGETLFADYCAACHQYDGQKMGDAPPLDGAPWVTGPEIRLVLIALHGVAGPMEIHGKEFDLEMPGFGEILGDEDLAALLTYVRRRFGEPSPPIAAGAIAKIREDYRDRTEYWTADELMRIESDR